MKRRANLNSNNHTLNKTVLRSLVIAFLFLNLKPNVINNKLHIAKYAQSRILHESLNNLLIVIYSKRREALIKITIFTK